MLKIQNQNDQVNINKQKTNSNAIILAAGQGIRMIPINNSVPKALLEVNGEILIERIIEQLIESDVHDITIVVGFMEDQFHYLIDKYGVKLVSNAEYKEKNNLHSLNLVRNLINNTYIWIPTNHRLVKIKFHKHLLNGVHEAEPDTWIFHLFYN